MENIERGTCVKFVPRTHQQDFIDILPKSGWVPLLVECNSLLQLSIKFKCDSYGAKLICQRERSGRNSLQIYKSNVNKWTFHHPKSRCWSYLGARGGRQTVSLQKPACLRVGIISHEFMHALGFVHEQSRYDRDKYITVMWPNIWRGTFKDGENQLMSWLEQL